MNNVSKKIFRKTQVTDAMGNVDVITPFSISGWFKKLHNKTKVRLQFDDGEPIHCDFKVIARDDVVSQLKLHNRFCGFEIIPNVILREKMIAQNWDKLTVSLDDADLVGRIDQFDNSPVLSIENQNALEVTGWMISVESHSNGLRLFYDAEELKVDVERHGRLDVNRHFNVDVSFDAGFKFVFPGYLWACSTSDQYPEVELKIEAGTSFKVPGLTKKALVKTLNEFFNGTQSEDDQLKTLNALEHIYYSSCFELLSEETKHVVILLSEKFNFPIKNDNIRVPELHVMKSVDTAHLHNLMRRFNLDVEEQHSDERLAEYIKNFYDNAPSTHAVRAICPYLIATEKFDVLVSITPSPLLCCLELQESTLFSDNLYGILARVAFSNLTKEDINSLWKSINVATNYWLPTEAFYQITLLITRQQPMEHDVRKELS